MSADLRVATNEGVMTKKISTIALVIVCFAAGCEHNPSVPVGGSDGTAPLLELGTIGLKKDILLTQASTVSESRRAKKTDEILFLATAEDRESGIKHVTLEITLSTVCSGTASSQVFTESYFTPANASTLPVKFSKQYAFVVGPERAKCGLHPAAPSSVTVTVTATTENGAGTTTRIKPAIVSSFGPEQLRVATFNLHSTVGYPDSTYETWGRILASKADVVMFTETPDLRRAQLLANAAGMGFVEKMSNGDIAIASRTQLYAIQSNMINPPGPSDADHSNTFTVKTNIDGYPHQFIGTHWAIRDANNVLSPAQVSSPTRLQAAQDAIAFAFPSSTVIFLGGDMNAFSGFGPQDHDDNPNTPDFVGSTDEINRLYTWFSDPFVTMNLDNASYCSNKRIDYVMWKGPYVPVKFEACFPESGPSDHPFIVVTFVPGDV